MPSIINQSLRLRQRNDTRTMQSLVLKLRRFIPGRSAVRESQAFDPLSNFSRHGIVIVFPNGVKTGRRNKLSLQDASCPNATRPRLGHIGYIREKGTDV